MKKIITLIIALVFCISLATTIFAQATEAPTHETTETAETEKTSLMDKALEKLTNSSFWVAIVGVLVAVIAFIAGLKKFINSLSPIIELIKSRADKETVTSAIDKSFKDTSAEISAKLAEATEAIKECKSREDELTTLIALLINNLNINQYAKTEILAKISGIKEYTGSAIEICRAVEAEVQKYKDAEEKIDTPNLDIITTGIAFEE